MKALQIFPYGLDGSLKIQGFQIETHLTEKIIWPRYHELNYLFRPYTQGSVNTWLH